LGNKVPTISGVLPIKNGEKWIPITLPKILSCLEERDELVIVDDGSTDNTLRLVSDFAGNDQRIHIVRLQSRGLVEALNEGIGQSKNSWIARFDIDDFYSQDRLKIQRLKINHHIAAIFTDYRIKLNGNYNLGLIASPITDSATRLSLLRSQRTAHPSALFSKEKFVSAGGYVSSEFPAEDLGLWVRISNFGKLISVDSEGLQYNLRQGSISRVNRDTIILKKQRIVESYIEMLNIDSVFDKLQETLETYSQTTFARDRVLLHLWDLTHPLSQKKLGKNRSQLIKRELMRQLSNPFNWQTSLRLLSQRRLRRLLR
jgi:glycosyltransferase involved in cell wall biosynthesis